MNLKSIIKSSLTIILLVAAFAGFAQKETPKETIVYFCSEITPENVLKLYNALGVDMPGKVGLKVHFGEPGNPNILNPELLRPLVEKTHPTFVETNVLYVSPRHYTESHIKVAKDHGFTFAPIDILDADEQLTYDVADLHLKNFTKIKTGSHFENYDSYIIYSHFKGHGSAGFGGAIKNIAMGMASPGGKMAQHANDIPALSDQAASKCFQCGRCVSQCPANAITVDAQGPHIDASKCIGCAKCVAECPEKLFRPDGKGYSEQAFLEKLVEYAYVLTKKRPMVYINVMANISEVCDCSGKAPKPFMGDVGMVASTDIVAIDRACQDLVGAAQGLKEAFRDRNNVDAIYQLDYAEKLGMGTQKYILIDVATGKKITVEKAVKQIEKLKK